MTKSIESSTDLFGLKLFSGRMEDLLTLLTDQLVKPATPRSATLTVVTPNPEQVVLTRKNEPFLRALTSADLRVPDGGGLVAASRLTAALHHRPSIQERLPGRVVVSQLLAWAHQQPITVLVIGGRELGKDSRSELELTSPEGVNGATGSRQNNGLTSVLPLRPVTLHGSLKPPLANSRWWWTEGYVNAAKPTVREEDALESTLRRLRPQLVLVAFGAPYQEIWLAEHRELLNNTGVRVAMAVGGTFDILTGRLQEPPRWMERTGLEWAYRLYQQPWRWRRQLRLLTFIWLTLKEELLGLRVDIDAQEPQH